MTEHVTLVRRPEGWAWLEKGGHVYRDVARTLRREHKRRGTFHLVTYCEDHPKHETED